MLRDWVKSLYTGGFLTYNKVDRFYETRSMRHPYDPGKIIMFWWTLSLDGHGPLKNNFAH